jgi:hypothetical protein
MPLPEMLAPLQRAPEQGQAWVEHPQISLGAFTEKLCDPHHSTFIN